MCLNCRPWQRKQKLSIWSCPVLAPLWGTRLRFWTWPVTLFLPNQWKTIIVDDNNDWARSVHGPIWPKFWSFLRLPEQHVAHIKEQNEIPRDGWVCRRRLDRGWPSSAWDAIPNLCIMASAALSVTWAHCAFFNRTASNESVKHDLTNWSGFPSDEPCHETVPLYVGPNVVTERSEMKKCNKQRCNKDPDRLLINSARTEKINVNCLI